MRTLIVFIFTSLAVVANAQTRFIIGSDGDYTILINQNVTPKSSKPEAGGYVDYYIVRENNDFKYLLSVRKVGPASDPDFIYQDGFKKGFLAECGCNFLESKKVSFRNFDGIQMKIKTSLEQKPVTGYTVGLVSSSILYNINFIAVDSKFDSLIPEYDKIMKSLIFR